ncbi:MAG TPA: c-type cytochrome [Kofleriaceae bacterium]|nr:c-type cytochrome [Kofleriaceae bacterium]
MRNRASGAEGRHELVRWLARWLVALTAAGLALVSGCGAGEPPLTSDRLVDTSITLADQIAHGSEVYGAHCADCHGPAGEGTAAGPPLVGPDALPRAPRPSGAGLRAIELHTARDVLRFMRHEMPADDPGSLDDGEYLAVLSLLLHANGVAMPGREITDEIAARIALPAEAETADLQASDLATWW